ncbi:hypothetical protein C8T65DRAFT_577143 [Cerioporus squamosus]|nr:hypothetical protein C8T65DRAFT_577143 [Cerioporus squamosus]
MTEPARKRPRLESHYTASKGPPAAQLHSGATKKDDEFWFDDGNLIVVAQDVEFRIYRGPLVKHSPVFRDMLTLPQPADASGLPCPVVQIPDHPTEFRHLLREFMTGNACSRLPDDKPSFDAVSAIVRLGHKYELDAILKKGLACLANLYPNDWWHWSRSRSLRFEARPDPLLEKQPAGSAASRCISVVRIARLTDTPSLLRPAFVECCNMVPRELMAGHRREDGVLEQLSPDDLARVLLARAELIRLDALAALRIFSGPSANCEDTGGCARTFRDALWSLAKPDASKTFGTFGPQRGWYEYFCLSCLQSLHGQESEERRKIWEELPSIFDIPKVPSTSWFESWSI